MNIYRHFATILVLFALFCWVMSSFYNASIDLAGIFKHSTGGFLFELNLTPFILFVVIGGFLAFLSYRKKKRSSKFLKKALWLPDEFEETDEREQQITAHACRAAYISMWYAFPLITILLLFYPMLSDSIPYYPIIVFSLLPFTQIVTYLISWRKRNTI